MAHPLILKLQAVAPNLQFDHGDAFCWSPTNSCVTYPNRDLNDTSDSWSLLHEAAHGILGHANYESDLELLLMESEAWDKALQLGDDLGITIDQEHVQDCLDTYRDWLHKRSTCPTCGIVSLQSSPSQYTCHNCNTTWTVSMARFCRPYRLKK